MGQAGWSAHCPLGAVPPVALQASPAVLGASSAGLRCSGFRHRSFYAMVLCVAGVYL